MPRKPPQPVKLPPLPFGNEFAEVQTDINAFSERMATVITSLNEYAALGDPDKFSSKSVTLEINGLKLVSSANSPVRADIGASNDTTLMIPFSGQNISTVGDINFRWQAHQGALFIPAVGRGGACDVRASLMVDLDPLRLQHTARAMLGYGDHSEIDLRIHDTRVVPLRRANNDFDSVFRHLSGVIDSVHSNPAILSHLGIDELFYRTVVMMLRPDLFEDPLANGAPHLKQRELDPVCDFIRSNLSERLTLSDLEKVSQLSARSLQYAFQQRFGCTPMQWVREERLLMARRDLQHLRPGESIADIAILCGFVNQGTFAAYYRRRFGELPSETVGKSLQR
jgi:AraC-like DNA-binding protein